MDCLPGHASFAYFLCCFSFEGKRGDVAGGVVGVIGRAASSAAGFISGAELIVEGKKEENR